jgi:hypothetical protein
VAMLLRLIGPEIRINKVVGRLKDRERFGSLLHPAVQRIAVQLRSTALTANAGALRRRQNCTRID